jgi:glycosyl transferase, family 25
LRAYYINLARRTDRRASMEAQLEHLGLAGERIEATLASDLPAELVAQHVALGAHKRFSLREFAVGVSHRDAYVRFLATSDPYALVLEDDIVLSNKLPAFLHAFEQDPQGVDLLRIETFNSPAQISTRPISFIAGMALHSMHGWTWGAAAYIVGRRAAQTLVDNPTMLDNVIDRVLYRPHRSVLGAAKRLQLVPALAIQADRIDGAVWGSDSDLKQVRYQGLKAPPAPLPQALAEFVDNEILIGLPSVAHRLTGLSRKRTVPFEQG